METIKNKTLGQDNLGSLQRIFFCDMKYLQVFPNIGRFGLFNVQMLADKNPEFVDNIKELKFIKETGRFTQIRENNENGKLYKQTVTAVVAKDYIERFISLWGSESRFLVFAYDMNNTGRVIGHIDFDGSKNGAKFADNSDTGAVFSGLNNMVCTFYCENKITAPYCNPSEGDGDDYFEMKKVDPLT